MPTKIIRACDDDQPVPKPIEVIVHETQNPVLYLADGTPLVRRIGF